MNFDPTSTDVRYVDIFKKCVQKFQASNNLIGQGVLLCSDTANLRTEKQFNLEIALMFSNTQCQSIQVTKHDHVTTIIIILF